MPVEIPRVVRLSLLLLGIGAGARGDGVPPPTRPAPADAADTAAVRTARHEDGSLRGKIAGRDVDLGTYHALLIGIDAYRDPRAAPRLRTAANDVRRLERILREEYGFARVDRLLNGEATRKRIILALRAFRSLGAEDSLLVCFQGHARRDADTGEGYWLPVDAGSVEGTWVPVARIRRDLGKVRARHTLIVTTGGFDGAMTPVPSKGTPSGDRLASAVARSSYQVIASGAPEPDAERGRDGLSRFGYEVTAALAGSSAPYLTAGGLHEIVARRMGGPSGGDRIPGHGRISGTFDGSGQFVFARIRPPTSPAGGSMEVAEEPARPPTSPPAPGTATKAEPGAGTAAGDEEDWVAGVREVAPLGDDTPPASSGAQVDVYHLLVASRAEAEELRRRHRSAGGGFEEFVRLARQYSKDAATRPLGGNIGWLSSPESHERRWALEALSLEPGSVSRPVRSSVGWHLIFVRREAHDFSRQRARYREELRREPPGATDDVEVEPSDPEAVSRIERYLRVIGGREALGRIQDRTVRFLNRKLSETGDTDATITIFQTRDHRIREEWIIHGFEISGHQLSFNQVYNGQLHRAWVQMFGKVSRLTGRTLTVFVWEKAVDHPLVCWRENGYRARSAGRGEVLGLTTDVVELAGFGDRLRFRLHFSRRSGLLLGREWTDTVEDESSGTTRTVQKFEIFSNYELVRFSDGSSAGIRVPMQVEIRVDGKIDTRRTFSTVRFNTGLDDSLFLRPVGEAHVTE